jgi:hypothetical protein
VMRQGVLLLLAISICSVIMEVFPIITKTFTGTESSFDVPRASVENTVNFMVGLLIKS